MISFNNLAGFNSLAKSLNVSSSEVSVLCGIIVIICNKLSIH